MSDNYLHHPLGRFSYQCMNPFTDVPLHFYFSTLEASAEPNRNYFANDIGSIVPSAELALLTSQLNEPMQFFDLKLVPPSSFPAFKSTIIHAATASNRDALIPSIWRVCLALIHPGDMHVRKTFCTGLNIISVLLLQLLVHHHTSASLPSFRIPSVKSLNSLDSNSFKGGLVAKASPTSWPATSRSASPSSPTYENIYFEAVLELIKLIPKDEQLPEDFISQIHRILWKDCNIVLDESVGFLQTTHTIVHAASIYGCHGVLKSVIKAVRNKSSQNSALKLLEMRNESNSSALYYAIIMKHERCVHVLLNNGVNPNVSQTLPIIEGISHDGKSLLHVALRSGSPRILLLLLNHPDMNAFTIYSKKMRNAWHYAGKYCKDEEVLRELMKKTTSPADLLVLDYNHKTPIHYAAAAPYPLALRVILGSPLLKDQEITSILLEAYYIAKEHSRSSHVRLLERALYKRGHKFEKTLKNHSTDGTCTIS